MSMLTINRSRQRELAWQHADGRYRGLDIDGPARPSTLPDPDPWPERHDIPGPAGWPASWPGADRDTVPARPALAEVDGDGGGPGPHLPPGRGVPGARRAVGGPAPGGGERPSAAHQV